MSERELELEFSVAGQPKLAAFVLVAVAAYVRDDDISRGVGNGEFSGEEYPCGSGRRRRRKVKNEIISPQFICAVLSEVRERFLMN